MHMSLFKAPSCFRTLINKQFHDCIDVFMVVFMKDLSVYGLTKEDNRHLL